MRLHHRSHGGPQTKHSDNNNSNSSEIAGLKLRPSCFDSSFHAEDKSNSASTSDGHRRLKRSDLDKSKVLDFSLLPTKRANKSRVPFASLVVVVWTLSCCRCLFCMADGCAIKSEPSSLAHLGVDSHHQPWSWQQVSILSLSIQNAVGPGWFCGEVPTCIAPSTPPWVHRRHPPTIDVLSPANDLDAWQVPFVNGQPNLKNESA